MDVKRNRGAWRSFGLLLVLAGGCEGEVPDGDSARATGTDASEGEGEGAGEETPAEACFDQSGHYPGGTWAPCISDTGAWSLVGASTPSSAARVAAYESMAALLWRATTPPGPEAFTEAAAIYGESGGVGSRVTRRYDAHISKPEGADCKADDAATRWPEYCVGPAAIEPLILGALDRGISGNDPWAQAHTVEAGLTWFYFLSAYKEAFTCAEKAADCDSSWAYYGGGRQGDEDGLGFSGEVQRASPANHQAVFAGLLAVRCWRDLDNAEVAGDDDLHQRALDQLDTALGAGLAAIIHARLGDLATETGAKRNARWLNLQILGRVFDATAREIDPERADSLMEFWANAVSPEQTAETEALIDGLFPCPGG